MKRLFISIILLVMCNVAAYSGEINDNAINNSNYNRKLSLSVSAGGQMFIGNEEVSSARFNSITPNLSFEFGWQFTSEIGVAANLTGMYAQSQTRYGRNPFVNYTDVTPVDGYYPYQKFGMIGISINCLLTIDLTNCIAGYNYRQQKFHVLLPVGMGLSCMTGKKENPRVDYTPCNFEFSLMGGFTFDYHIKETVSLFLTPRIMIQRGSIDYSPYSDNESGKMDLIPSLNLGVKFDL